MNEYRPALSISSAEARRIDQACDRFEMAWKAGGRPDPAAFLPPDGTLHPHLLRQILLLDWHYRRSTGDPPRAGDYHTRFPGDSDVIEDVAREMGRLADDVESVSETFDRFDTPPAAGREGDEKEPVEGIGPISIRYELMGEVGRGGIGIIYRGRDRRLGRALAVKVLRTAYRDQPEARRRFVVEARVGSRLQHPAIVPVYELGRFADGRPFITMKLVEGQTFATLLAGRTDPSHDLPRWLGVFEQVCQAMAYAHSCGIIHRDLKPDNVMVGAFGEVQIMDWGFAKKLRRSDRRIQAGPAGMRGPLRQGERDGKRPGSERGGVFGTPAYMPPEQARGETRSIGPWSDVFALGAMLCEILTGLPPYAAGPEEDACDRAAAGDVADACARLGGCGADEALRDLARRCLAADPDARPPDAGAVARALTGYIASAEDRLRRAQLDQAAAEARTRAERRARRLTMVLAAALLVGAGIATWQAIVATRAKRDALAAAAAESSAKDAAAAKEAETGAVLHFVESYVFAAARPKGYPHGLGRDVSLRQAIEAALPSVRENFADKPLTEAALRFTLASSFDSLGDPKTAAEQYRRAFTICEENLGADHPETLRRMSDVAISYASLGRYADAAKLHEEILKRRTTVLGRDHPETLRSANNVAMFYFVLRRRAEALSLREETLARQKELLGPDHPDTLISMNNLATSYAEAGRHEEAIRLFHETLDRRKAVLGPDHFETLESMNNLAMAYAEAGRREEALLLREQTLVLQRAKFGLDHPTTLRTMNNVANSYYDLGRYTDSLKLYGETLALQKAKLGADHPDTLNSMWGVAANLVKLNREAEALPVLDDCLRRAVGKTAHRSVAAVAELRLRYFEKRKDAQGCRSTAEMWESLQRADPVSLFVTARIRAVTANVERETVSSPGASKRSDDDADRAMFWLGRAVATGYRDIAQLLTNADLDALRSRADYIALLWDLADMPVALPK